MPAKVKQTGVTPTEVMDADKFNELEGRAYGGDFHVLSLKVGEGCYVTYSGSKEIETELGKTDSMMGELDDGALIALPLATIFKRNFEMAGIEKGERFALFRGEDTIGKRGRAKGKTMENYRVKKLK